MNRSRVIVAGLMLLAVVLTVLGVMNVKRNSAPSGQNSAPTGPPEHYTPSGGSIHHPSYPRNVVTREPIPESLAHLQFAADAMRCPVSSRSAIMTSCLVERYQKMRDKALLWRYKYEALMALERAYWAALAREGLTQRVEHIPSKP